MIRTEQDFEKTTQKRNVTQSKKNYFPGSIFLMAGIIWLIYLIYCIIRILAAGDAVQELNTSEQLRNGNTWIIFNAVGSILLIVIGCIFIKRKKKVEAIDEDPLTTKPNTKKGK